MKNLNTFKFKIVDQGYSNLDIDVVICEMNIQVFVNNKLDRSVMLNLSYDLYQLADEFAANGYFTQDVVESEDDFLKLADEDQNSLKELYNWMQEQK